MYKFDGSHDGLASRGDTHVLGTARRLVSHDVTMLYSVTGVTYNGSLWYSTERWGCITGVWYSTDGCDV